MYDLVTQTLYCPVGYTPANDYCGGMYGVGYRTYNGQQQLVMGGGCWGWNGDWMTPDGGATWGLTRFDDGLGHSPAPCQANALAGTSSDAFYTTWWDPYDRTNAYKLWVGKLSGPWPASGSDLTRSWDCWWPGKAGAGSAQVYGVSGTGRAVGVVKFSSGDYRNFLFDWTGTGSLATNGFNGLYGGPLGWAYSVTADGNTVFGSSPTPADGQHYHGYKAVFSGPNPTNGTVLASIIQLPEDSDTSASTYYLATPYGCTLDGKYAVGTDCRGLFKAVVWDLHDGHPANWTVTDLTDLASANGILGDFTGNLRWAYSVGTNAAGELVIVGSGVDSSVIQRAWAMTVPLSYLNQPTTVTITNISLTASPGNVVISFWSGIAGDTTASFTVQSAATLVNAGTSFADVSPPAVITGSAGSFQATVAVSGSTQFYWIHHP